MAKFETKVCLVNAYGEVVMELEKDESFSINFQEKF